MKLIKITPRGFCSGVVNAWKIVKQTIDDNPNKKIYMLGLFVHNPVMVNELKKENVIILDDTDTSRYELVNRIENPENEIIILSAHGTDYKTINLIHEKKMILVDTTCEYVYKTHDLIKKSLNEDKTVIYLGVLNHPESLATTAISNKIVFIHNIEQLKKQYDLFHKKVLVTNQTTLSTYDLNEYYTFIKENFTKYEICNDLCNATIDRQNAIIKLNEKIDILIVVGSQKSNNSKQLVKIGRLKNIKECYLINSLEELDEIPITEESTVAITSGASTPTFLTNKIINKLENLKWN